MFLHADEEPLGFFVKACVFISLGGDVVYIHQNKLVSNLWIEGLYSQEDGPKFKEADGY